MGSNTSSNSENKVKVRPRSRSRSTIRRVYPETREIRREGEINTESESVNEGSQTPDMEIRPAVLPLTPPPLPPQVPDRTYNIPGLLPPLIPAPILETLIQPCTHDSAPAPIHIEAAIREITEQGEITSDSDSDRDSGPDSDIDQRQEFDWERSARDKEIKLLEAIKESLGEKNYLTSTEIDKIAILIHSEYTQVEKRLSELEYKVKLNKKLSRSNYVLYQDLRMLLVSKKVMTLNDARREVMVTTHRVTGEVAAKDLPKEACVVCHTVHIVNPDEDCLHRLTAGGPRVARFLKYSRNWTSVVEMVIIGYSTWLYLPPLLSMEILNLGQFHMGKYNCIKIDDRTGRRIDRSQESLYTQLKGIIGTLSACKTVKVLVEYQEPPNQTKGTHLEMLVGFVKVIKDIQRITWHELVVLTSPFLATAGDTEASYQQDSWQRYVTNQLLEWVCRSMGVPCLNPQLQQIVTDERPDLVWLNPAWRKEPLSTPIGNVTRELLFRQGVELTFFLEYVKKNPILLPRVDGFDEQDC